MKSVVSLVVTFVLLHLNIIIFFSGASADLDIENTTITNADCDDHSDSIISVSAEISKMLNNIEKDYDKRVRPNYGGEPVTVGITMYIISISSVSEVDMDFTFVFYFRQFWKDDRLKFKGLPGVDTLHVGPVFLDTLWVPDTFFVNEKKSYFHTATTSNELLQISQDGRVLKSTRLTVTASCPMDLSYFPMDTQLCQLEMESFGYSKTDIIYKWEKDSDSFGIAADITLPQFRVLGHRLKSMDLHLFTANYSRLSCEIQFGRSVGYYLIQIYIPSGLNVIISWLSFWLSRNATTARVALGVTTVLTMATLMSSTNAALPKISYIKAIDVYLATCFLMVFSSLLQNAIVGYMKKRIQFRRRKYTQQREMVDQEQSLLDDNDDEQDLKSTYPSLTSIEKGEHRNKGRGQNNLGHHSNCEEEEIKNIDTLCGVTPFGIDKYSRIFFPLSFILFNIMYWTLYMNISNVVEKDLVPLKVR